MLESVNKYLLKFMPIMTPISVVVGIIFSEVLQLFLFLVPWIFAFMTFTGSLGSKFSDLRSVVMKPFALIVCLVLLHVVMPIIAFGTGNLIFSGDQMTITGLVLAFVIPTGVSSLIWVTIHKGNVMLALSIILLDTMLAPFIVPTMLHLFVGTAIEMDGAAIMKGLIWMIVVPSIAGMALNDWTKGKVKVVLEPKLAPFSKLALGTVVAINSSAIAPYFKEVNSKLVLTAVVVFMLALIGYIIGYFVAALLGMDRKTTISMTYNSGMRNISSGAVIAIAYFPAPVAVPVIIGMLFQQILASLTGTLLTKATSLQNKQEVAS